MCYLEGWRLGVFVSETLTETGVLMDGLGLKKVKGVFVFSLV